MEKLRLKILHESEGWTVFRVVSQPDPWPGNFDNGEISIISHYEPSCQNKEFLYVRGYNTKSDNIPIVVPSARMESIRKAVRAFNAKHALTDGETDGETADIIE